MTQYLITAFDGTDNQALDRRMAAREAHLKYMSELKANDNFVVGGAILSDQGQMIGSSVILQFETQAEFDAWYAQDPYIIEGVWQQIDVKLFRVANF
jgi:uncharacterized protein YciI